MFGFYLPKMLRQMLLLLALLLSSFALYSGECENKYPLEKIITEQVIETPFEIVIQTPVEIAYFVTVQVPYTVAQTCFKSVSQVFRDCNIKRPWKCFDVTKIIQVPFDCTYTAFKDVEEKRFRTEFKNEIVTKIEKRIQKLEDYKRPLGYAACLTQNSGEALLKAQGKEFQVIGSFHEAVFKLATCDEDGAKKSFRKANKKAKEAVEHVAYASETAARATYDLTYVAPLLTTTILLDKGLNTHLTSSYVETRDDASRNIREVSKKVGAVLEVTAKPENLGKIAFIYAATTVGGPFGAALANIMYDKIILKKSMTEKAMLRSFAIGAAAGYAAEGVQGALEGKKIFEAAKYANYLSKVSSAVAQNLTTDVGNVALNGGEGYNSKDFLKSILSSVAVVEVGNDSLATIIESTVDSTLNSVATQGVEEDFNFKKIDFKQVENSLYQGFANGVTRESVHAFMDATVIKAIPEDMRRIDKKAMDELEDAFYKAMLSYQEYQREQIQLAVLKSLFQMNKDDRENLFKLIQAKDQEIKERIAQKTFGKNFKDLTAKEILSDNFKENYLRFNTALGEELIRNNPQFAALLNIADEYGRNPAGAPDLFATSFNLSTPGRPTLTLLEGGLQAAKSSSLLSATLETLGVITMILYSPGVGEGSDDVSKYSQEQLAPSAIPLPDPTDNEGWDLYTRAIRGDRAAAYKYLNRDEFEKIQKENGWSDEEVISFYENQLKKEEKNIDLQHPVLDGDRVGNANKLDFHHAFPDLIDNFSRDAQQFSIPTKGEGGVIVRNSNLYQLEGSLNGTNGVFEWIVDQGSITHRRFIPGGKVTGKPNQIPQ